MLLITHIESKPSQNVLRSNPISDEQPSVLNLSRNNVFHHYAKYAEPFRSKSQLHPHLACWIVRNLLAIRQNNSTIHLVYPLTEPVSLLNARDVQVQSPQMTYNFNFYRLTLVPSLQLFPLALPSLLEREHSTSQGSVSNYPFLVFAVLLQ